MDMGSNRSAWLIEINAAQIIEIAGAIMTEYSKTLLQISSNS